jgi:hypothetical protein
MRYTRRLSTPGSPTMRPTLVYASLLTAFVLTGCGGDGATVASQADRVRMGATAAASASLQPVIFSGVIANYTVTKTDAGYVVTDTTGAEAPRTVAATARLRFADVSLAFDASGNPGQAYRLYRAAFAREPDAAGLGYWIGALDQGATLTSVAHGFTDSAEFKERYASALTNRDIVAKYYVNMLNREGEADGMDYWTGVLDNKQDTLAGVLRDFSESTENKAGAAAAIAAGIRYIEYGVRYPATAYPVRAAYQQGVMTAHTDYMTVAGTCPGYASFTYGAPTATPFEGQSMTAQSNAAYVSLSNCSARVLAWTQTDYYDSNKVLQGYFRDGQEYDIGGGSLPATARVGDSGVYATQTAYTDSSKQTAAGKRTLSYALEADGESANTAILTLTATHTGPTNVTNLTRTSRYRIGAGGTLQPLTVDERYSSGSYLVYTLDTVNPQPAKLTITDTVPGTGTAAQIGQTVTAHYTGWLYDPKAPDFKGQKFDSSAGGSPFSFVLGAGQVIAGWDQGILGMRAGGKRTLLIPATLAYGASGAGSIIKPNAALMFEVELVSVK